MAMTAERVIGSSAATWEHVLAHREPDQASILKARFEDASVPVESVARVLADSGESLSEAMLSGEEGWEQPFGGLLAVALLAGEVAAHSAYLVSRASAVRAVAVEALLEDFSAVAVASGLGISRQKVYEIGRNGERIRRDGGGFRG